MTKLVISNAPGQPVYRQLYDCIAGQIARGEMAEGESLPSIRGVAGELCISVITVRTAYEMLEKDGFIYTVQGKGCFVKGGRHDSALRERAREKLRADVAYYKSLGIGKEELIRLIEEEL
ncbi:MAG: GntR family transcriptional regulator [Christensenellales bacterium]